MFYGLYIALWSNDFALKQGWDFVVFIIFIVKYRVYYQTVHNNMFCNRLILSVAYLKWANHFITTEYNAINKGHRKKKQRNASQLMYYLNPYFIIAFSITFFLNGFMFMKPLVCTDFSIGSISNFHCCAITLC